MPAGAIQRFLSRKFVDKGDDESENSGTNREKTKDGMQKKRCRDKKWNPWKVKECDHGRAGYEFAHSIGIAKWLSFNRPALSPSIAAKVLSNKGVRSTFSNRAPPLTKTRDRKASRLP